MLAAEEPLSLQAHPSAAQAAEGFAREDQPAHPRLGAHPQLPRPQPQAGTARRARTRSRRWRDSGRSPAASSSCARWPCAELDPFVKLLAGQADADGLRALFTTWITAPQADLDVLVPAVLDGAMNYLRSGATEFALEAKTTLQLGELYPGDAGVLAAMLLNRISLEPGEGIYLPAGNLHAYLHGWASR